MPNTPIYGFETPAYGDEPDGPAALVTLATEIENRIKIIADALAAETAARISGDANGTWVSLPTLATDITAYSSVGTGYAQPAYKIERGRVYFRGLLKTNVVRSSTFTICTMPIGARPSRDEIFVSMATCSILSGAASAGTAHTHTTTWQVPVRLDVTSAGVVSCNLTAAQDLAAGAWFSISNMGYDLV